MAPVAALQLPDVFLSFWATMEPSGTAEYIRPWIHTQDLLVGISILLVLVFAQDLLTVRKIYLASLIL